MVGKRQKQVEVANVTKSLCIYCIKFICLILSPLCWPISEIHIYTLDIYVCTTGDGDTYRLFKAKSFSLIKYTLKKIEIFPIL